MKEAAATALLAGLSVTHVERLQRAVQRGPDSGWFSPETTAPQVVDPPAASIPL
jgi:hypothetical protein